jgi:tetratricopeptide (TPR) repeat protein
MRGACFGLAVLICLLSVRVSASSAQASLEQSGSAPDFDELSRRAADLVQSNPQQAAELYRQALALRPSWAEGWFYLGASLNGLKQNVEAAKDFRRSAVLAPENGAVWAFLGLAESELSQDRQALADIRKGESLGLPENPQFISAVRNRAAALYLRAHDFDGAVEQLRPLAKAGDNSSATIDALGVTALTLPYPPSGVPPAKRALVQLAGRALYALYAEQADEGAPLFENLITEYPNEPGVHYLRGIYLTNHDPEAARVEFARELQITPSHVPARLQIGILDLKAGNAESAAEFARQALKREPGNPLAHGILGRAFSNRSEYAKAIPELETAVKLDPGNAQLHFSLGQAYHHVGRDADARKQEAEYQRLKALQRPNAG